MSDTIEHTISPWRIEDRTRQGSGRTIYSPTAHFGVANVAHYISKADAAVIVVAPEALEFCRMLINGGDQQEAINMARKVLERADEAMREPQRTVI